MFPQLSLEKFNAKIGCFSIMFSGNLLRNFNLYILASLLIAVDLAENLNVKVLNF